MTTAFCSPHSHLAQRYSKGMSDYIERSNAHHEHAMKQQSERTKQVPGELSFVTHWENPQALRLSAHESELAQECLQLAQTCQAMFARSQMRQYQHTCYCKVRTQEKLLLAHTAPLSLREVSNIYAKKLRTNKPPNSCISAPPVLATCHASNAPGLSPIAMNKRQATTRE